MAAVIGRLLDGGDRGDHAGGLLGGADGHGAGVAGHVVGHAAAGLSRKFKRKFRNKIKVKFMEKYDNKQCNLTLTLERAASSFFVQKPTFFYCTGSSVAKNILKIKLLKKHF